MRKNGFLLIMAVITLALSACSGRASAAQLSREEIISGAYTAVALTSMAQLQMTQIVTNTPIAEPTATPAIITVTPSITNTSSASSYTHDFENPYLTPLPSLPAIATVSLAQPSATAGQYNTESSAPCDGSTYVDDMNIPDGTVFAPGETFTKTWKIKNTGACAWNRSYAIAFSGGDDMSGTATALRRAIPPNGAGNISVELTAPDTPGTYTGYWVMTNSSGAPFGNVFYVQIVVQTDNASKDE
ncbi:MAG: hypothetical protein HY865_06870 [Chloroflexi bacterium]|nr:hypothetical protein [Chloroflexota bacterium]